MGWLDTAVPRAFVPLLDVGLAIVRSEPQKQYGMTIRHSAFRGKRRVEMSILRCNTGAELPFKR
jgi:hypothetical protein